MERNKWLLLSGLTAAVVGLYLSVTYSDKLEDADEKMKYYVYDKDTYFVFDFRKQEARKIRAGGSAGKGYQVYILVRDKDHWMLTQIKYRTQKYGYFGMKPVGGHQLGLFAVAGGKGEMFIPILQPQEQFAIVFREMESKPGSLRFGPWMAAKVDHDTGVFDFENDQRSGNLESYQDVSSDLSAISEWNQMATRFSNREGG